MEFSIQIHNFYSNELRFKDSCGYLLLFSSLSLLGKWGWKEEEVSS